MKKPEKKIYENQEEVHDKIVGFLKNRVNKIDCEVYLVGSSTTRQFGKYVEKFGDHDGSDIDAVVMVKEKDIPKDWKYLEVKKDWFRLYRGGKININGTIHKADFMVVKPSLEKMAHQRMKELKWIVEKLK